MILEKCRSWHISLESMEHEGNDIDLTGTTTGASSVCPCCGRRSRHVHSYRWRRIQLPEELSCHVTLTLRIRHFYCDNPSCHRKVFSEPLALADKYGRMSHEVALRVRDESLGQPGRSASATLHRQHIFVSGSTCLRVARRLGESNPEVKTSGYIGIDDFAKRKGHEYMCAAVDHYTRQVLAVFDSRYGSEITRWIASHPEIRLVSRDGSQRYRRLIEAASPHIVQVSDRFHLMKNLRDVSVDLIRSLLGERKALLPYPYPTEEEAYRYIVEDILSMGEAKHRERVRLYYQIRGMKDTGQGIYDIARELGVKSQKVYRYLNMDLNKLLSEEQRKAMKSARLMAQIITAGSITPTIVAKKLDGKLPVRLVCRAMRTLVKQYKELRRQVREHNKNLPETRTAKVKSSTIWHYIMTGRTSAKRLLKIGDTHPLVDKIIQTCISFRRMIHGEDGAPDVTAWVKQAHECHVREMTEFAEYIKKDRKAVEQAYLTNYSNAVMEGTVNKIKVVKRSMYNKAQIQMLRAKLIYGASRQRGFTT